MTLLNINQKTKDKLGVKMLKKLFPISCLTLAVSTVYAMETIDVAILYTAEARDNFKKSDARKEADNINLYIDHMVSQGNIALRNSRANVKVRRLPVKEALVTESESNILNYQKCNRFYCKGSLGWIEDNSENIRKKYGADLVVLVIHNRTERGCGLGSMPTSGTGIRKDIAFSWISTECGAEGLIHEVGHNLGLGHGHRSDAAHSLNGGYGSLDSNARGYYEMGRFHTIMAYNFSTVGRRTIIHQSIPYFSNPELQVRLNDGSTAIPSDGARNAARGINQVAGNVSRFMPTVVTVGEPTPKPPVTTKPVPPVTTPKPKPPVPPPVTTKPVPPVDDGPVKFPGKPKPPVQSDPDVPFKFPGQPPVTTKPVPPVAGPENPTTPKTCTVKIRLPFNLSKWFPITGFNPFGNSNMTPFSAEGEDCQSILTSINSFWGPFISRIFSVIGNNWYKGMSHDITQQLRPNQNMRYCTQMALNSQQPMRRWGVTLLKMEYNNGKQTTYRRIAKRSLTSGYFSEMCGKVRVNDEEVVGLQKASLVNMVPRYNSGFFVRQSRIRSQY